MAGEIYHEWNGTVLTITSDSGTSSADLKGDKGCRGAQGKAGVVIDEEGNVLVDVATEEYVKAKIAEAQLEGAGVDLSAYYTKSETDKAIQTAVESIDLSQVDLSDYATKSYVDEAVAGVSGGGGISGDYYTKAETDSKFATQNLVGQLINEAIYGVVYEEDLEDYTTESEVLSLIEANAGSGADLSNYYTKTEVDQKIADAQLEGAEVDLSNYYTKAEIEAKGYQTEGMVSARIYDVLDSYYFNSDLPNVTSNDEGKILMVVDGAWAATTIGTAEGGSY